MGNCIKYLKKNSTIYEHCGDDGVHFATFVADPQTGRICKKKSNQLLSDNTKPCSLKNQQRIRRIQNKKKFFLPQKKISMRKNNNIGHRIKQSMGMWIRNGEDLQEDEMKNLKYKCFRYMLFQMIVEKKKKLHQHLQYQNNSALILSHSTNLLTQKLKSLQHLNKILEKKKLNNYQKVLVEKNKSVILKKSNLKSNIIHTSSIKCESKKAYHLHDILEESPIDLASENFASDQPSTVKKKTQTHDNIMNRFNGYCQANADYMNQANESKEAHFDDPVCEDTINLSQTITEALIQERKKYFEKHRKQIRKRLEEMEETKQDSINSNQKPSSREGMEKQPLEANIFMNYNVKLFKSVAQVLISKQKNLYQKKPQHPNYKQKYIMRKTSIDKHRNHGMHKAYRSLVDGVFK